MSLVARLAALERRRPPSGPSAVTVLAIGEHVRVAVCDPGAAGHAEPLAWAAYRARCGERDTHRERWVILPDDGTPIAPASLAASLGFGVRGAP